MVEDKAAQLLMSDRSSARLSKTDALLVKAKSISDGGRASGITYLRRGAGGENLHKSKDT